MINAAAIATKLNVLESAIVRIEEWANVMFVVVKGLGARFVSKKVAKIEMKLTLEKQSEVKWVCRSEVATANKHFPDTAWVAIDRKGIIGQSAKAPSAELIAFALEKVAKFAGVKIEPTRRIEAPIKTTHRRTSCLNCGITNTILMGRGYCTDCYGECD